MAVGIGSNPRFSVSGEAGTVQAAYQITTAIAKLASEVNTATLNRDVILVGGPCANNLVATLFNVATTYPECAADFTGLSDGIIREFTNAFGSGQKALVVAGVTADDTRALATRVLGGDLAHEA
jgi:S-layer protein (TIGR01564 family)